VRRTRTPSPVCPSGFEPADPPKDVDLDSGSAGAQDLRIDEAPHYAFPHAAGDESRRLELFEQRLDPLTIRRLERLGIAAGASCLEIGGGHGSITHWLAKRVGLDGHVIATDLQLGFLDAIEASNVEVVRHDVRTETFPERSFDLVHARAVLMHLPDDLEVLHRIVSWLAPNGWLLLEEPDFGMWQADADPVWASHPDAWHQAFPSGSLSRGRSLLRQIHQLDLVDVGADAEADVIEPGTPLAEFYRLSMVATGPPAVAAGALTSEQAAALIDRPTSADFLGCGFVHIGVWGRRQTASHLRSSCPAARSRCGSP
jgi:trans-aconitate methyltransferase